jgi:hypothetical protein
MIGVPVGIEFIDHRLPPILFTVPEVLVTVPELTVTPTEYVNKSVEHVAEVVTVIVGNAFTLIVVVAVPVQLPEV